MIYAILIAGGFLLVYFLYFRKEHVDIQPELTNEEKFIEELFHEFEWDCGNDVTTFERPKTKEEILRCKQICEKYGYNYYMLFKNIKQPFWRGYISLKFYGFDKGTLTLVPLKEGESNLK